MTWSVSVDRTRLRRGRRTQWQPALKNVLAATIGAERFKCQAVKDPGALRAVSQEQWQAHVKAAGHYPARRDCLQCVVLPQRGYIRSLQDNKRRSRSPWRSFKGRAHEVLVGGQVYNSQVLCDG